MHQEGDLLRLRRAFLLRSVLELNGARANLSLFNFVPGRIIQVPDLQSGQPLFLSSKVARYFYHSAHFYAANIKEIEASLQRLDQAIRSPEFRHLLKDTILPPYREYRSEDYRKDFN